MANTIKKDAPQWSNAEIKKWATGEVETAQPVTDRQVADEVIRRQNLEQGMSVDDIKAIVRGEEVANEAPEEEPKVEEKVEAPVQEPKPEPVKKEKPVPSTRKAATPITTGGKENEISLEIIEQNMREYVDAMRPGRALRENEGAMNQVKLYRTVQMVLRQKGSNFQRAYGFLLNFVHEHRKSVFNEMYVFRFFDSREMRSSLPSGERRRFERILNLLLTTCNPSTRAKSLEQVDIDATMESFKDPEMHQRVLGFYKGV